MLNVSGNNVVGQACQKDNLTNTSSAVHSSKAVESLSTVGV